MTRLLAATLFHIIVIELKSDTILKELKSDTMVTPWQNNLETNIIKGQQSHCNFSQ